MYGSGCDFKVSQLKSRSYQYCRSSPLFIKDRDPTAGAGSLAPATPSTCCVKVVQYAAVTAVAAN